MLTVGLDSCRDVLTQALVNIEHIQVDASQLNYERVTHSLACPYIGLQDASQLFHSLWVLQDIHILSNKSRKHN